MTPFLREEEKYSDPPKLEKKKLPHYLPLHPPTLHTCLTLSVIVVLLTVNHVLASLGRPVQQPVGRTDVINRMIRAKKLHEWKQWD